MSPTTVFLMIAIALVVVLITMVDKSSARRDKENTANLSEQLKAKGQEISDMKANLNQTNAAIKNANMQSSRNAEALYSKAVNYVDQKDIQIRSYTDSLYNDVVSGLDSKISILTDVITSLDQENQKLRTELEEQKRRLDYYLKIDQAAGEMTIDDDAEERAKLLAKVREQVAAQQQGKTHTVEKKEESKGVLSQTSTEASSVVPVQSTYEDETEPDKEASGERILDDEQEFARNYMESTSENVFITGKAGTGKSFLLNAFRATTGKGHIVLAPTGIAALNVDGATLHSAFGYSNLVNLDVDDISEKTIKLKSEKKLVLRKVNTIIIDEISMVRADTFDKIDRILKAINHSNEPFGGKQILLFGDLFQLPPVTKGREMDYLYDRYGGTHFFHSDAYKAGNFKFVELTRNHRQKEDKAFFEVLNRIREGRTTKADIDLLNTRYTPEESQYDRFVALFPTKAEAEKVNTDHINQLETREFVYQAEIVLDKRKNKNKSFDSVFPITNLLRLKVGASVMMVANDPERRWVNGSLGIVKDLDENHISVSFGEKRVFDISPFEFNEQEITYSDGKIVYEKIFSVMQYPVVPAYAITIHKSQGQTYSNIACDIDRCFASGQAYVALSRCASLNGLHLKSLVTPVSIKVDQDVLDFYSKQLSRDVLKEKA